jgi:hypothetical protein
MEVNSEQYHSNSKTRPGMHKQMRSWFNFRQQVVIRVSRRKTSVRKCEGLL